MFAAAARAGLVTSKPQCTQFTDRFTGDLLTSSSRVPYNPQHDRKLLLLLDAMITCSLPEHSVHTVVQKVADWLTSGTLHLWRIAPYLSVCFCPSQACLLCFYGTDLRILCRQGMR